MTIWHRPFARMSFATRVAIATSILIAVTCVAQSVMLVHRDLEQVGRFLVAQGRTLSETLARDAELAISSRDRAGLLELLRPLMNRADVVYCRVLDDAGQPLVAQGRLPATLPPVADATHEPIPVGDVWEFQAAVRMLDTRPQREEIQLFDEGTPAGAAARGTRIGTVAVGV